MSFSMEDLPKELLVDIVKRIDKTVDRNSVSLICKRLYAIDGEQREFLRVGRELLYPAIEALTSLCVRFPNIRRLEIVYSGWEFSFGQQLDNRGLRVISLHCPLLTDLTLSYCSSIDDSGLAFLASCQNLRSLKLKFARAISSKGILSLAVGCKNLSALHLIHCEHVSRTAGLWLAYLGKVGKLEDLSIKNCRGIVEDDLIKLGPGWNNLQRLEFEKAAYCRCPKVYNSSSIGKWRRHQGCYENLRELSLVDSMIVPSGWLSCLFGRCNMLERLHLDMCIGLRDSDLVALSKKSRNLRSISLRLPSQLSVPFHGNNSLLTDESLRALANGCTMLEVFEFSFSEQPSFSPFSQSGILMLIQSCPLRVVALDSARFFNDTGMEALCSAPYLQTLKLVRCHEVLDEGIQLVQRAPSLTNLELCMCSGVTDYGIKPLIGSCKLNFLSVEGCPQVSEEGVQGAAKIVSYRMIYGG